MSFPGLSQCKKCGYNFAPVRIEERPSPGQPRLPGSHAPPTDDLTPSAPAHPVVSQEPPLASSVPPATTIARTSSPGEFAQPPSAEEAELPQTPRSWQEEISERVEHHRRRRARLRGDDSTTLELDFDAAAPQEGGGKVIEFPVGKEEPASGASPGPVLDSLLLDKPGEGTQGVSPAGLEAVDLAADHEPAVQPVEIVLDSAEPVVPEAELEENALGLTLAPMGRRFIAGVLDALVLLVSAGLFALIFWRAGGRMSPQPLNLAVVAFIAVFFIMAYFGLFTALTSTTPGLLWMGLEVRTVEGGHPTAQDAFWRAFGYLVSIAALMLGFIWALVDSEGLSWHDRMSRTYLAVASQEGGAEA